MKGWEYSALCSTRCTWLSETQDGKHYHSNISIYYVVHKNTTRGLEIVTNKDMDLRTVPAIACKWVQEMYPTILWSWGVLPTCTWKGRNKKVINGKAHTTLLPSPSVQPFWPFFPANFILKPEKNIRDINWGLLVLLGLVASTLTLCTSPCSVSWFYLQHIKNVSFSCSLQPHWFLVAALLSMYDSSPPFKCLIKVVLPAA